MLFQSFPYLKWQIIIRYVYRFSVIEKRILIGIAPGVIVILAASASERGLFTRSLAAAAAAFAVRFQETYVIGNDFGDVYASTFVIFVIPYLDATFHGRQTAFAQVVRAGLSELSPSHHWNKIRFPLSALRRKRSVYRQRELRYRNPCGRVAKLRILGQSAN
jgi:hypothetical protein